MFTGIIQHLGRVAAIEPNDFGAMLRIDPAGWEHQPALGSSIAVNGCCLTIARDASSSLPLSREFRFDVVRQTLSLTTLGDLRAGDAVNLEHAVTPATLLGGHIVQGHVDGVGVVTALDVGAAQHRLRIEPPEDLMRFIVERGSIAIDGVSLTVAACGSDWFEVALIPTTLRLTNLSQKQKGAPVNLETDYIAKVIVNYLERSGKA